MNKNRESLAKMLTRRVGVMRAAKVLSFLVMYGTLYLERGERVSLEEFAEFWGYSPSTAYRTLRVFREAIPEFEHPADLVDFALAHREEPVWGVPLTTMWGVA